MLRQRLICTLLHTFTRINILLFHHNDFLFYHIHIGHIRILYVCEVRIENSVLRVTVWHHKALPSDAKQDPEERNFISTPHTHVWFFFLYTFRFPMFYFKSSIHYHTLWRLRRTFRNLTSLLRRNDINQRQSYVMSYTTNAHKIQGKIFFFHPTHG